MIFHIDCCERKGSILKFVDVDFDCACNNKSVTRKNNLPSHRQWLATLLG